MYQMAAIRRNKESCPIFKAAARLSGTYRYSLLRRTLWKKSTLSAREADFHYPDQKGINGQPAVAATPQSL